MSVEEGEGGVCECEVGRYVDLDVVQPVCGLKVGEPSLVIHIWVANVLQLAEAERMVGEWWDVAGEGRDGRGEGGRGDGGRG